MLVLCAIVNEEVVHERTAQATLWQHTLNGMTQDLVHSVRTLAQFSRCVEALTTRITSVTCVNLISLLLAGEYNLGCIDNDYVVTTVYVGSETWLVLSAEQLGYLRAETTNYLVGCVDYNPLFLSCLLVYGDSLET